MEDWFARRLGLPFHVLHRERRCGNPIVRTRCEFVAPCRFGETLEIELAPVAVGRSSLETRLAGAAGGAPRFVVRHKTAMISMQTMRAIELPPPVRARAQSELAAGASEPFRPLDIGAPPADAFRSRHRIRHAHCDPGERVYFARFFEFFEAALEDWRPGRLLTRFLDTEFLRACMPGDTLELSLWERRHERGSLDVAVAGAVGGEPCLRAAWTLAPKLELDQGAAAPSG